jgi:hypothetical protein
MSASIPFVLNSRTLFSDALQFISDIIVVRCCNNSTSSTPFLSHKTVVSFLAYICLNFFRLFSEYVYIQHFGCPLLTVFINETQVSSPVAHTMWLRNSSISLCYYSEKSRIWSHTLCYVFPWALLEPILCNTCGSLAKIWQLHRE